MFQGLPVPESPELLAKMQLLGPFSKLTEPEFPGAAVDTKFPQVHEEIPVFMAG